MKPARAAALIGYFGLLVLWLAWATIYAPPRHAPAVFVLGIAVLPLLPAVFGLLHDRRGSFLWLGLLSLLYFIHGVSAATDAAQRIQAGLEIVFSLCLFGGSILRLRT